MKQSKLIFTILLSSLLSGLAMLSCSNGDDKQSSIFDLSVTDNHGQTVNLTQYKGNVLLIVNTATHCGFTPQYNILENLYVTYHAEGFEILDFPCNQFAGQAPGTDAEIDSFCVVNYHTSFPRFAKVIVNDTDEEVANPLFAALKNADYDKQALTDSTGHVDTSIRWNFTKFLIDRNGHVIRRFEPGESIEIMEPYIQKAIQKHD